jgi:hypothetical protein
MRTLGKVAEPNLTALERHLARDYTRGDVEQKDFVTITEQIKNLKRMILAATAKTRNENDDPRQEREGDGSHEREQVAV